jgi:CspA family cold shock protein
LPSQKKRPRGTVKAWNLDRGFGFVKSDDGQDVFVHYTAIRETIHKYLREGERVEFDIAQTDRGVQARNCRILPKA